MKRDATEIREPTFLILTALAAGPLHGYAIVRHVDTLSDGRVTLRPGTLYGALDRLAESGLVVVDGEGVEQGRFRRYYKLTGAGAEVLATEAARLEANARHARTRLGVRPVGS
ncbi:MAG: PadR family transcriptional regulator [Actinomycetota bacterium]|nr:PadR family transcriptional regulator [Actinomycetota bacterium]